MNSNYVVNDSIKSLGDIKEMYTLYPTESEFEDFVNYVEYLYSQGIQRYGTIKIIPPSTFKPECCFNKDSDKKFSTRVQKPFDMSKGKVSWKCLIL